MEENKKKYLIETETKKIRRLGEWFSCEKTFKQDRCLYVVAKDIGEISRKLTLDELNKYDYFIFVTSSHYFIDFPMRNFNVLFLDGWKQNSVSRKTDYEIVNWAIKNQVKLINYDGENSDLIEEATDNKEIVLHGLMGEENPVSGIRFHPEVIKGKGESFKI